MKPVDRTFGTDVDYTSPDFGMREALKRNVWKFSVAKNYNDSVRLSNLLLRPDGTLRPWNEFKREAMFVVGESNRYLKTEYDTIVAGAQMSRLWMEIQRDKHIFPYVQFDVVMDGRTSDICSPLDKLIFEVDDPVLAYYFPPNHFNCRTTVKKLRNGVPSENYNLPEIPEAFRNNIGESGLIFTDENSYISNTPKKVLEIGDHFYQQNKSYEKYRADEDYYDVEINDLGGVKATHKNHNFHHIWGKYEIEARDNLFDLGHSIIMESELMGMNIKTPDGILNGKIMDIKTVLGNNGKIGKNSIIDKIQEANGQGCEIVVLQFPKQSLELYDLVDITSNYNSAVNIMNARKKTVILKEVWVMLDKEIKKFNF